MVRRNAIVVLAVGPQYLRQFSSYAKRCDADLVVCTEPPDPRMRRNLLSQKMLLPSRYQTYEWICIMDVDMLILPTAPSVFEIPPQGKAFGAVPTPRGTEKFNRVAIDLWHRPDLVTETAHSYFTDRGFKDHPNLKYSINGGLMLCRTDTLSDLFEDFYKDSTNHDLWRPDVLLEEAPMAYLTQVNDMFWPVDKAYNTQFIFELYGRPEGRSLLRERTMLRRAAARFFPSLRRPPVRRGKPYREFIRNVLAECYILHFAGGYPIVDL